MPISDDETVGNHRSGGDHVWCFDADNPVSPITYRLRSIAYRSGRWKVEQAEDRKRKEMSFEGSHSEHTGLQSHLRQGHKPPRPNSQASSRDIGLSSICPVSM